jgi:hypothetical protein
MPDGTSFPPQKLDTNPTFGVFFMAQYDAEVTCASSSPMLIDFRKADASLALFGSSNYCKQSI